VGFNLISGVVAWFKTEYVVVGKGAYEQNIEENERVRKELYDKLNAEKKLKRKLQNFLRQYDSPLGSAFINSAVSVEVASGIDNFALFSISVSGAESTFGRAYPIGSHNTWGIGAFDPHHYSVFGSWEDGQLALARLVKKYHGNSISFNDLPKINSWYAASPSWANSVGYFWKELQ